MAFVTPSRIVPDAVVVAFAGGWLEAPRNASRGNRERKHGACCREHRAECKAQDYGCTKHLQHVHRWVSGDDRRLHPSLAPCHWQAKRRRQFGKARTRILGATLITNIRPKLRVALFRAALRFFEDALVVGFVGWDDVVGAEFFLGVDACNFAHFATTVGAA